MNVQIINSSHHPLPAYQTIGAAGMDLYAFLPDGTIELKPLQRLLIPTGLSIILPPGYEAQIRPRSGMAFRQGITCLNSPGTIDSDYRGEIKVLLINLSDEIASIEDGDRIAQMVIARYEKIAWELTNKLEPSTRGQGGFGSTGMKDSPTKNEMS